MSAPLPECSSTPSATQASLIEIFASVQGEGLEVGCETVFVRFGGCDLRCLWCDSPHTWKASSKCRIEKSAGCGEFTSRPNPIPVEAIAGFALGLAHHRSTWISLTGGEPLLQPEAVSGLVDRLVAGNGRIYLETHGLHAQALSGFVEQVDLISMDWKLSSDVRWGPGGPMGTPMPGGDFHEAHEAFLRVATRAGRVYVKVVVTPSTRDGELDAMLDRIVSVSSEIPLVIQPVTPMGGVDAMPEPEQLLGWLARASERLADVRLIPQTHPIYGVL